MCLASIPNYATVKVLSEQSFYMKKYISLWVGATLLISPVLVSAQTVGSLQAQLQTLEAEIAALQSQGTTTASVSGSRTSPQTCINLTFAGGVGTSGSQISSLQTFLGIDPPTGYFGMKTKAILVAWQSAHGILASGYFGALTRATMRCSNQNSAATNSSTGTQNAVVAGFKEIQAADSVFNVNTLNNLVFTVNEIKAYSGTDIPTLKAFANQWGPALITMQSQWQTLHQSNLSTLSSSSLDSMISAYMQSGSALKQAIAAYNTLPSSELTLLSN